MGRRWHRAVLAAARVYYCSQLRPPSLLLPSPAPTAAVPHDLLPTALPAAQPTYTSSNTTPQGRLEAFFGPSKIVSSTSGKRKEPEPKGKGKGGGAGAAKKGKLGAMGKKKK